MISSYSASARIPLPAPDVISSMSLEEPQMPAAGVFDRLQPDAPILDDFCPWDQSLEWRLIELYWSMSGVLPFVDEEVPFLATSSGRLSEKAAALLFDRLEETRPDGQIAVLEVGAGTGLFARYLIDAFERLCRESDRDYNERIVFLISDFSQRSLDQWRERSVFANDGDQVILYRCDARDPALPQGMTGKLHAVFCNNVLDGLPTAVVQGDGDELRELHVRTRLIADRVLVRSRSELEPDEIQRLAASNEPEDLVQLVPLVGLFDYEIEFRPARPETVDALQVFRELAPEHQTLVANYGALRTIRKLADLLHTDGFILVNDYGATQAERKPEEWFPRRFGPTVSCGLRFPLLARALEREDISVLNASCVPEEPVPTHLVQKRERQQRTFLSHFGPEAQGDLASLEEARAHQRAGRQEAALASYRGVLDRSPRDWTLLAECAEFVGLSIGDYDSGIQLARAAVELNPWYSPWTWNVLGDCLFCQERLNEAHQAYLQAARINPNDARTGLNLASTLSRRGAYQAALESIARGLAFDRGGLYRPRLLQLQQHILLMVEGHQLVADELLARRAARFSLNAKGAATRPGSAGASQAALRHMR